MKVIQISAHFFPNVGGVETHLSDLVNVLIKRRYKVFVLTYQPLTTKITWKIYENRNGNEILRIPWLANLFYKFVSFPVAEFLYLLPGLFLLTPVILVIRNPKVIHAHGLVAGFVGVFWGKFFHKKVVVSTHSIYNFSDKGLYRSFAKWIFMNANKSLGLSIQAEEEIKSLGISKERTDYFIYWVDLDKFKKVENAKFFLKWKNKFIVLFVGRLVEEKGIIELLQAAKIWDKNITLVIAGSGPLEEKVREAMNNFSNIEFRGIIPQDKLPVFYSASDILIVPSISEEGFGRVILESLACGTPVIGSNRGAIPEAMDETVGKLIDVTKSNIKEAIEHFYKNRGELKGLSLSCRKFAERRYSEKNISTIINSYTN